MLKVRARNKSCCPLCRVELLEAEPKYTCEGCQTTYHSDCAEELGGCGTIGCPRMGVGPKEPTPSDQRWRARGRRRVEANRERRASRRRMRQEHVDRGGEASGSWLPPLLEALFYIIWIILEIAL